MSGKGLGKLIRNIHKSHPKTMEEDQKKSIAGKRKIVKLYNYKGHGKIIKE